MKMKNELKNKKLTRNLEKKKLVMLLLIFNFIFMFLINLSNVDALGITPGRTTFNFEPNLEKEVEFIVLNNEHKNIQIVLMIQGELNNSITLYENSFDFSPSQEQKTLKYKFKIPNGIEKNPGLHTAEIVALEVPKPGSGGAVGAYLAVVTQLFLYVPYPGKYVDADLNIFDAEENSNATFVVPVINRGKLGLSDVRAVIDIYGALNEKIDSIETDYAKLLPEGRTELTAKWQVKVPRGNYLAKVSLFYDGESKIFEKQFSVGNPIISIESILVNNFHLGEIAKLQILVENKWNQELKNVFANLMVYNKDNQAMADVKSASEIIPALTKKELIAYWDTSGVSEGEYSGKLMVRYGEKSTDKNLLLKVKQDSLDIVGVGYAIRPQGSQKGINITMILLILVIILLIVNLSWFVFFRRFIGSKKK